MAVEKLLLFLLPPLLPPLLLLLPLPGKLLCMNSSHLRNVRPVIEHKVY
jgi:hypothetical protein